MSTTPADLNCVLLMLAGRPTISRPAPNTYNADNDHTYSPNVPYNRDPQPVWGRRALFNAATAVPVWNHCAISWYPAAFHDRSR